MPDIAAFKKLDFKGADSYVCEVRLLSHIVFEGDFTSEYLGQVTEDEAILCTTV